MSGNNTEKLHFEIGAREFGTIGNNDFAYIIYEQGYKRCEIGCVNHGNICNRHLSYHELVEYAKAVNRAVKMMENEMMIKNMKEV